jgi:hypothetical protein
VRGRNGENTARPDSNTTVASQLFLLMACFSLSCAPWVWECNTGCSDAYCHSMAIGVYTSAEPTSLRLHWYQALQSRLLLMATIIYIAISIPLLFGISARILPSSKFLFIHSSRGSFGS